MRFSFQLLLQRRQRREVTALEFLEPALRDLIDWYRIDEVQLFAA